MISAKDLFIYSSTILAIQSIKPVKYGAGKKVTVTSERCEAE